MPANSSPPVRCNSTALADSARSWKSIDAGPARNAEQLSNEFFTRLFLFGRGARARANAGGSTLPLLLESCLHVASAAAPVHPGNLQFKTSSVEKWEGLY